MAKKAAAKAKRKSTKRKVRSFEPRPSYIKVQGELDALLRSLSRIVFEGRDDQGELGPNQAAQASASLKVLQGARVTLECPQLFGPYTSKPS